MKVYFTLRRQETRKPDPEIINKSKSTKCDQIQKDNFLHLSIQHGGHKFEFRQRCRQRRRIGVQRIKQQCQGSVG